MVIATDEELIGPGQVPREIRDGAESPPPVSGRNFQELKAEAERRILVSALERNGWQIGLTAKELGLADHASLLKIMRRHDLRRPDGTVSN
jgi:transcriptional regulator with GAF, ATPase, and Fis domain